MKWLQRVIGRGSDDAGNHDVIFDTALEPEQNLAIVGDIHGRADLLEKMISLLEPENLDAIVFVGDFVDRGDDSAVVLSRLIELTAERSDIICLCGNHEKMLMDFLDRPRERGLRWMRNGGLQTLASYGIRGLRDGMSEDEMEQASNDFRQILPSGTEDWIRKLPLSWTSGNLWVVHAAADPKVEMAFQSDRVLLWGHRDFFEKSRADQQWVAHGHTIMDEAIIADGRISVDTGAYATGRLTAAIVGSDRPSRLVQTH